MLLPWFSYRAWLKRLFGGKVWTIRNQPLERFDPFRPSIEALEDRIQPTGSTTALTADVTPSVVGQTVNLTATVAGDDSGMPTGSVTFYDGTTNLGSSSLTVSGGSDQATLGVSALSVGTHYYLTAVYGGDSTYDSSTSSYLTQTVSQASTSTALSADVNPSVVGQTVTFTAALSVSSPGSGTPTGTVTFYDNGSSLGTGTVNSSGDASYATSALNLGTHYYITASYGGDSNYTSSSSSDVTQTVNQASTGTTLTADITPSVYGQTVTFTAAVLASSPGSGTPTGTASFYDYSTYLGSGTLNGSGDASFATSALSIGTHPYITASYGGDSNYTTSTSADWSQDIVQASSTTVTSSTPNPSVFGQPVTFTATVAAVSPGSGTATGSVYFYNGSTALGSATLSSGTATFSTSSLSVGAHACITAQYTGDSNFSSSTSADYTETVNQANTTTALSSSSSSPVFGQSVTLTATVSASSPGSGTPTGTVTFYDGSTTLGTGTLSSGSATYATSSLSVASHSITAVYAGDTNFIGNTSSAFSQAINAAATTTSISSSSSTSTYQQSLTFTATIAVTSPGNGTPTGTVTFYDGSTSLGTGSVNSSGIATLTTSSLGVGSQYISATYGGDSSFSSSSSSNTPVTVYQDSTTTALTANISPSVHNQSITLSATVVINSPGSGAPTGTVTFYDGSSSLGTGSLNSSGIATLSTSSLATSSHTLYAYYGGDTNDSSSNTSISQTVNPDATTTTMSASVNPSVVGQTVTFTAAVVATSPGSGTPTGTVSFYDNTMYLGSGTLNSSGDATFATSSLSVGHHCNITASYGGDTNDASSISSDYAQTVDQASTTTVLSSSPGSSAYGQSIVLIATVSVTSPGAGMPTGNVTFYDGTTNLGTATLIYNYYYYTFTANITTSTLGASTHNITAVYSGDTNFLTSTASTMMQTVNPASTSTSWASSVTPSLYGQAVTFSTSVYVTGSGSGTPTGTVTFYDGSTSLGTGTLDSFGDTTFTTSSLALGYHLISVVYGGASDFASSSSSSAYQVVNADATTTSITADASPAVFDQLVTFTASVAANSPGSGTPTGTVTFYDGTTALGTGSLNTSGVATLATSSLTPGTHTIDAAYGGDSNYGSSNSCVSETVDQAPTTTTVSASSNPSVYGQSVTFSVDVSVNSPGGGTPTGTVVFYDGGTAVDTETLSSGSATYSTSSLTIASHSITAVYSGDTDDTGSTSSSYTQTVNGDVTTTTLSADHNPAVFGQSITYTADVAVTSPGTASPSGTVTFMDGSTTLGTGTLSSGVATFTISSLSVTTHTITAVYGGDSDCATSTSSSLAQVVNHAATSATLTSDVDPSVSGELVTFSATISVTSPGAGTPTGTVSFYDNATLLGTGSVNSSGIATLGLNSLAVGAHTLVHAVYGGNSSFTGSTTSNYTQTVNEDDSATYLTLSTTVLSPHQPITLYAQVIASAPGSGFATGTITFTDGSTTLGTGSLDSAGKTSLYLPSGLPAGSNPLTASFPGDGNFNPSTGDANPDVGNTPSFVNEPSSDCGCNNVPGQLPQANSMAGSGPLPPESTPAPVRYADGVVTIAATDLSSAGFGMPWGQTRTWSNGYGYSAGSVNGSGWTDTQLPYAEQLDGDTTLAVITNGVSAEFFDLVDGSYQPRFFDQSTLVHDTTKHEYVLTDERGDALRFADYSGSYAHDQLGTFVSFTDPAGNVTSVTAYTTNNQIAAVERSGSVGSNTLTEAWVYTYITSGANTGLLENVTLARKLGSASWDYAGQVEYTYYNGSELYGNVGDLKTAVIADGSGNALATYYYRYYTAGDVGDGENGYVHGLKYVFTPDSFARLSAAYSNPYAATDAQVAAYADNYFAYDSSLRATKEVVQGLYAYEYSYTASSNTIGMDSWAMKTVETLPDGNENIVYTNGYGEVMLFVYHDTTSDEKWDTFYKYDGQGRVIMEAAPAAVTGYDDSYADLLHYSGSSYAFLSDTTGLITIFDYYTSTTATSSTAGDVLGYQEDVQLQQGQDGTGILQESWQYYSQTAGSITIYPVATDTVYRNTDGTGGETTSYSYTWFSGTDAEQSATDTLPVISSAENGPGTADVVTTFLDNYGNAIWTKDGDGYLDYTAYDLGTGAVTESIVDVNTAETGDFTAKPSGWSTPSGGGLNLVTTDVVDDQGRTIEETDPNGNITYTVYNDVDHEYRVYPGWNSSTGTPTGPTEVYREDSSGSYTETFTMSATPHLTSGVPDGTEAISGLQTLERDYVNAAGQETAEDDYFNLSGLTYSTGTMGTAGTNYYVTQYSYDDLGDLDRTVSPTGTIERDVYDGQQRLVSVWIGTYDTPTSGSWSPSNPAGMTEVSSYQYDNGGVGDGNLTQETDYPHDGSPNRVTDYYYDWRDRQVAKKDGVQSSEDSSTHRPITFITYDNLDEETLVQVYDGDGVTISTTDGEPVAPSSSLLVAQTAFSYDDQGRVYQQQVYSVDPSSGDVSTYALTTNYYYDHRGDMMAEADPGGLWTKSVYDGAGRDVMDYTTDGGSGTTWSDAGTVTGDIVLEQTQTIYDDVHNIVETITKQHFDNDTNTGALGDLTTTPYARTYYSATYYNAVDQALADVDVGTNGGSAWTLPTSVPSRSDTVLVTSYSYNSAGWLSDSYDPLDIDTRTSYDALGRVTKTVVDYTDGTPTASSNQTTEYTYDGDDHVLTVTAVQPSGTASQTTEYIYGVVTSEGSAIDSADLLEAVEYPNPTSGSPAISFGDEYTYNALGQPITFTDGNGTTHTYSYDVLGRMTSDAVTTLASGVDGSIQRIDYGYDAQGNVNLITSYDAASGGDIVNQVEDVYNGLGQLITEYQANDGAVNTSTTPKVQYTYSEMSGGANNSRLVSMTYPSGYTVDYNYGTSGSLNNSISRLDSISDSGGTLESYKYLGLSTVVERDHPQDGVNLTYISQTGSTGDAGDRYTGLDRFGRVVEQNWYDTNTSSSVEDLVYGYDRDSDVLYTVNEIDTAFSDLYTYNSLNELTSYEQGTLNSGHTAITGTPSASQSFSMDALGNFTSVTTNGTTQTRTANALNEITSISGATTPTYDENGNTTTGETGKELVYDAWNRLVVVKNSSGTTIDTFSYDGLNREIEETPAGDSTTHYYYSADWQVLEERVGGSTSPDIRYIWSPVYVDAMILRDRDTTGDGTLDERLYAVQDANYNVTAVLNTSGAVQERYVYDPYGDATILDNSCGTLSGSSYDWEYYHQGLRYQSVIGDYQDRNREYDPKLMRFLQMDPTGFAAGDTNIYRYVRNSPTIAGDPSGLNVIYLLDRDAPGTDGYGHAAVMVGSDKEGWTYYSFYPARPGLNVAEAVPGKIDAWPFKTLDEARKSKKLARYTDYIEWPTADEDDKKAKKMADEFVKAPFDWSGTGPNCVDFARLIMIKAGIPALLSKWPGRIAKAGADAVTIIGGGSASGVLFNPFMKALNPLMEWYMSLPLEMPSRSPQDVYDEFKGIRATKDPGSSLPTSGKWKLPPPAPPVKK